MGIRDAGAIDGRWAAGGAAGMAMGGEDRRGDGRRESTGDVVAIISGIRAVLLGGVSGDASQRLLAGGDGVSSRESAGETADGNGAGGEKYTGAGDGA